MHSQPRLLLICGMPVTGKTAFGNWLSATHGFLHLDLEARDCLERNRLPPFWPERIWNLDAAGLATFIAYLRTTHPRTVLTWAFHTDLIPFVRQLTEQGLIPWWFEGDRLASRQKHLERGRIIKDGAAQPGMPDLVQYDHYVASLIRHWSHIAPIFGNNILHTLSPEGTYLAPETIARRIGL